MPGSDIDKWGTQVWRAASGATIRALKAGARDPSPQFGLGMLEGGVRRDISPSLDRRPGLNATARVNRSFSRICRRIWRSPSLPAGFVATFLTCKPYGRDLSPHFAIAGSIWLICRLDSRSRALPASLVAQIGQHETPLSAASGEARARLSGGRSQVRVGSDRQCQDAVILIAPAARGSGNGRRGPPYRRRSSTRSRNGHESATRTRRSARRRGRGAPGRSPGRLRASPRFRSR